MTRLSDLTDLRKKVAAGRRSWILLSDLDVFFTDYTDGRYAIAAYNGSVDAALKLCEAVLPGASVLIGNNRPRAMVRTDWGCGVVVADCPARALLLATLDALIQMEKGE